MARAAARGLPLVASGASVHLRSPMASQLRLKLFVAGDSPRAREAAENLARAVRQLANGAAQIETVDVLENPALADEYRILTTPTVVREAPAPRRRVTGDLRDTAQVLAALNLVPPTPTTTP
jgi:circadian clock protein KaiB